MVELFDSVVKIKGGVKFEIIEYENDLVCKNFYDREIGELKS